MKEKRIWKKYSAFQIVAFILTVLLSIAIIVQIGIIINLKNKTQDTERRNEEIEKSPTENQSWQICYLKSIENLINL